ncbi:MAG: alanine racemase [Clostridia bacterium]|nr:alanine racemase [Clostridia bacterium]
MNSSFDRYKVRAWAEIDVNALVNNYTLARRHLNEGTGLLAVVKANAYGHGIENAVKLMNKKTKVDGYAVATPDEALELRATGVDQKILILGYTSPICYREIITAGGILPTVFSYDSAKILHDTADEMGIDKVNCYFALDSGMHRIGFSSDEAGLDEAVKAAKLSRIWVEGIFSHFAKADEKNRDTTHCQEDVFYKFKSLFEECIGRKIKASLYNSAAISEPTPRGSLNDARLGIMLYGLKASDEIDRESYIPAMEFKTRVVRVHTVPRGEGIGYGHSHIADKEMRVATLSVGYADGYRRDLSNKGEVIIRGKKCPIVGRVCMDMMMVCVDGLDDVAVGDVAVLFGRDGDCEITADNIADSLGTIGHEIVCGISKRVPRIYKLDGEFVAVDKQ